MSYQTDMEKLVIEYYESMRRAQSEYERTRHRAALVVFAALLGAAVFFILSVT